MLSLTVPTPLGPLTLHQEAEALVALDWGPPEGGSTDGRRAEESSASEDETPLLVTAAQQINAYFYCGLRVFELPLAPAGTPHQRRVWRHMRTIPYGQTRSYGAFAQALESSPRAVGGACGRNPLPIIIPCHRVAAADGTLGGYSGRGGVETKRFLLELEGAHVAPGPLFAAD